jgi:lipopolysaccharide transport system ATP-binding protein
MTSAPQSNSLHDAWRADGTPVYGIVSDMDDYVPARIAPKEFGFALRFPALSLLPGKYSVRVLAADPEGLRLMDTMELPLFVAGETRELGLCRLPHEWQAIERVAGHLGS